ncbi:condensation domain-containing protein [Williamsia phyllosphaerae]|uniref:Acyltransferase n=1 Tax=Williamsia phyllosphaerae TaxID=885042 RepID=A0ABQ1V1E6_9NOCA|nr:condensation domain-containing protein [Williamsia phyllosphaerae]GGF31375.1 acyltransferase [Williamsia phyllosphaerae]
MIAGTLQEWDPAAGELVEWRLRDGETVTAGAPTHPLGPSFLQRDHLVAATAKRATGAPHRAVVMMVTDIDEPLDRDAMRAAITDFVRAHDEVRSFFEVTTDAIVRRVAAADGIEFDTVATGPSGDHTALIDRLHTRIDSEAVHDRLPGIAFGAIDAGDSFGFYVASDHSHTDGTASIGALGELFERYRAHRSGAAANILPAGSHLDYIADEYARAARVSPDDPRVETWRSILADHGRTVPRSKLDLGLTGPDTLDAIAIDRPLASAETTAACERRARAHGGSLLGLLFAALARAEYEITGDPAYFTSTVLSTRDPEFPGTQGWLCNFAPVAFRADSGEDFDDLVLIASEAVRRTRDLKAVPVHAVLGLLAAQGDFVPDDGSPQMVSYLDFRRLADETSPEIADGRVIPGVGRTRNANLWINRNSDGLRLLSHLPDTVAARASVTELHDRVGAVLAEHASRADLVPTTVGDR